ncbi:hypothetical protein [Raoultibacter timonensis]|uniref:hypothetical protein n=1 Tax=Raoultibacter timonensis TaxID=1907662 RepID=UPI001FCAAFF3|nr:hypothetical protein [Raoultibacter timonensis]
MRKKVLRGKRVGVESHYAHKKREPRKREKQRNNSHPIREQRSINQSRLASIIRRFLNTIDFSRACPPHTIQNDSKQSERQNGKDRKRYERNGYKENKIDQARNSKASDETAHEPISPYS